VGERTVRIEIPFEVKYLTDGPVPIGDIIDSLISAKILIEEGGYNLARIVPGLHVEQVQVNVSSISQESPLRELLLVAFFVATQQDLEKEVPALVELLTGTPVPENFKTLVTLSVLTALFYGAGYVKDMVSTGTTNSRIKRQLEAIIKELAARTGKTEDQIKKFLDEHYKPKPKIKVLAAAAVQFFRPSKSQSNAPIRVNGREIATDVVSDLPASYSYEEVLDAEYSRPFQRVQLELHAQDKDREASGWAAIPRGITDKRLKMRLVDGVVPSELWGRDQVHGDIIIKFKRVGTDMVPTEIHLTRVLP
jgi:hypothetical protein